MTNIWGMVGFVLLAALVVPKLISDPGNQNSTRPTLAVKKEINRTVRRSAANAHGQAVAYRDAAGQFSFNARLNGVLDNVLVDTGASYVAINETLAARMGINWESGREVQVSTANGNTVARAAEIDDIEIDNIRVQNVQALVLPDESLSHTLLGMTFLKRLERFEIESQRLTLTQ